MSDHFSLFIAVFDETRTVYRVDGVSAIPLDETRATATINMLATLKHSSVTPVVSSPNHDDVVQLEDVPANEEEVKEGEVKKEEGVEDSVSTSLHVTFLTADKSRKEPSTSTLGDDADLLQPPPADSSGQSTPTKGFSSGPMAKAIAAQLSFWNRISKRAPESTIAVSPELRSPSTETVDSFDGKMVNGDGPAADVLKSIIAKTAPAPMTTAERHSELDEKIVRETIKEFIKGGMYFSYGFGMRISRFILIMN